MRHKTATTGPQGQLCLDLDTALTTHRETDREATDREAAAVAGKSTGSGLATGSKAISTGGQVVSLGQARARAHRQAALDRLRRAGIFAPAESDLT